MKLTNWKRITQNSDNLSDAGIYIMYDDRGICLYVGMSTNAGERLHTHLFGDYRSAPSLVGEFIARHKDTSALWPVVILEPDDCAALYRNHMLNRWKVTLPAGAYGSDEFRGEKTTRERIESAVIGYMTPMFNRSLNNGERTKPLTEDERGYYFGNDSQPGTSSSFYITH